MKTSVVWEELGGELLVLHIERSQLRWLGYQMLSKGTPLGGVPDMSHQEEIPRKTQNKLMCRYHQAGPGTCWDPLGRAGGTTQVEGSLDVPAPTAAQTLDKPEEWTNE